MRIIRRGEGRSEPRVLVGRVVGNEVDKDLQPSFVGALDELVEVLERPVLGVDVVVVGHVVAVVLLRRGIERSDPYRSRRRHRRSPYRSSSAPANPSASWVP